MEFLFRKLVEQTVPKINPIVGNSLAYYVIPETETYINSVFKSAAESFPDGLEYVGPEIITPQEEYDKVTRPQNNKRTFDMARSNLYAVRYNFRYKGEDLPPRYFYLPYVSRGGLLNISGALYHISPVLIDDVISPGHNSVFVRLLRDRLSFERTYHSVYVNGKKETTHVVWSEIYRRSKQKEDSVKTTRCKTTIVHYLLAKYGFDGMFHRYVKFIPEIGTDIDFNSHPPDKWKVYESTKVKPRSYMLDFYEPSRLKVAIKLSDWNPVVHKLVTGFFYIVDHFPNRVTVNTVNKTNIWMILIGHIRFGGMYGEATLFENIKEHFDWNDQYIDSVILNKLHKAGYLQIGNFYDLLFLIVEYFDRWVVNLSETPSSIYHKSFEILYYVLYSISEAMFTFIYKLDKQSKKKQLSSKEIVVLMNRHLNMGKIFKITRSNFAVSGASYPGDNLYIKVGSTVVVQKNTIGPTRQKVRTSSSDVQNRIDLSQVEGGSLLYLSKSHITPAAHLNPYVNIDLDRLRIVHNTAFSEMFARTEEMLKRTNTLLTENEITIFEEVYAKP